MKLHTKLTRGEIYAALFDAKQKKRITDDIDFMQFSYEKSRSRPHGYLIQLGTYDKTTGPTNSRHYKNTGAQGAGYGYEDDRVWAATYDEWGWFIAEIFHRDPDAVFGSYKGKKDFESQTGSKYVV